MNKDFNALSSSSPFRGPQNQGCARTPLPSGASGRTLGALSLQSHRGRSPTDSFHSNNYDSVHVMVNAMVSSSKPAPQAGRSQRRGQETREKVIQAAAACVAEEGFASANTNRIVERAGVTWGVLQHHFGDKSGLLDAVLERGMSELEAGFDALTIEGDDVYERVAQVVNGGWRMFTAPLSLASNEIEVNTRAPRADDPSHVENLLRMNQRLEHLVLSALAEALGRKPTRGIYGAFLSALRGFALTSMMTRLKTDFRRERKALAEMIVAASR